MYALHLSAGIKSDLRELKASAPQVAAAALTLLQELKGSQEALDSLTIHNFEDILQGSNTQYHVSHWWELYRTGKNIWRLKTVDTPSLGHYRIIYGYSQAEQAYYALGIVKRDFDYDLSHPVSQRILSEYEELCS